MRVNTFTGGYMPQTYTAQFGNEFPRILIGSGLESRIKFDPETKRPVETGEIDSPEACIVGREIYVRASGLKAH